jgi:hypothetical protein
MTYTENPFCCNCGEEFCEIGLEWEDAPKDDAGRAYCCQDCLCDARADAWENRAYSSIPPDYND